MLAARRRLSRSACSETPNGEWTSRRATKQDDDQDDQRVGVGDPAGEIELEACKRGEGHRQRADDDARQAVGAAGQPVELVGELVQDRGDAERHHQPGQVGAAQDQHARRQAEQRARGDGDDQADDRIGQDVLGEQRRRVRAEAEERRVAERDDAGVAQDRGRARPRTGPGWRCRSAAAHVPAEAATRAAAPRTGPAPTSASARSRRASVPRAATPRSRPVAVRSVIARPSGRTAPAGARAGSRPSGCRR